MKKLTALKNIENNVVVLIDKTSETKNAIFGNIISCAGEVYVTDMGEVAFLKSKFVEMDKNIHEEVVLK